MESLDNFSRSTKDVSLLLCVRVCALGFLDNATLAVTCWCEERRQMEGRKEKGQFDMQQGRIKDN